MTEPGGSRPITKVTRDPDALTLTVVADFPVRVGRLWEAYVDPRQLERFWGPPTWPATFTRHEAAVGGRSVYTMTGPGGDSADLEQLPEMGMEQGLGEAMGQMDGVLADLTSFAAGLATATQVLSGTQARVSRVIRGTVEQVWRAHHDPQLLQRRPAWSSRLDHACLRGGHHRRDKYRYEWEPADGAEGRFGFGGELLESAPPYRAVTTERLIGLPGEGDVNELTLTPLGETTLLALVITFPDADTRDAILATGMTDGMETSYRRLETEILTPPTGSA